MKRILAFVLILLMTALALASCGVTKTTDATTEPAATSGTCIETASTTAEVTEPIATEPAETTAPETTADEEPEYFTFELVEGYGDPFYAVNGLTELGKTQQELTVPVTREGKDVAVIAGGAFANATSLKTITIPAGIESIGDGAFTGCTSLASIILPATGVTNENVITVCVPEDGIFASGFLAGANTSVKIYVPATEIDFYRGNYFWDNYGSILEELN